MNTRSRPIFPHPLSAGILLTMIIDVHTHAFTDSLAQRAMGSLTNASEGYKPFGDGTVASLLSKLDTAGVDTAFIANIATKPAQVEPILEWSRTIRSERIIPLASVHPDDPDYAGNIARFREEGFSGVKLHPMYQKFNLDDSRIVPFFRELEKSGMFVLLHAGYDIAFPGADNASPKRLRALLERVPDLEIIAAHLGGWHDWEAVERDLAGSACFFDTSFIAHVEPALRDRIITRHGADRIVFGSDFPWQDLTTQLDIVRALPLAPAEIEGILGGNAVALLERHGIVRHNK